MSTNISIPKILHLINILTQDADGINLLFSHCQPAIVRIVKMMAETGFGTDACLRAKCLPLKVHFYSPIPEIDDLRRRGIWKTKSEMPGVDFNTSNQICFLQELGNAFGHECDWPCDSTGNPLEFFTNNGSFSYGCAAALHTIIRKTKPKRFIEIGSGNSSLIASSAIAMNCKEQAPCDYTIIDPYPRREFKDGMLPHLRDLHISRVEMIPPSFFDVLNENDILFIDSGHVVKTGGDVNFLILEVLPRLRPGVIVHFHDIPQPYEYQEQYFTNPSFRMFWTEGYLLQAFLCCNRRFEILLAMCYIMQEHMNEFEKAFPPYDNKRHWGKSGSFWIRSKSA